MCISKNLLYSLCWKEKIYRSIQQESGQAVKTRGWKLINNIKSNKNNTLWRMENSYPVKGFFPMQAMGFPPRNEDDFYYDKERQKVINSFFKKIFSN